jgi:WD40 repeat protein
VKLSPDGKWLAFATTTTQGEDSFHLINLVDGSQRSLGSLSCFRFGKDGRLLAVMDDERDKKHTVVVRDVLADAECGRITVDPGELYRDPHWWMQGAVPTHDGLFLIWDNYSTIWNVTTGQKINWQSPAGKEIEMLSYDGRYVLLVPDHWHHKFFSNHKAEDVEVWNILENRKVGTLDTNNRSFEIEDLALSPDGRWLLGREGGLSHDLTLTEIQGHVWTLPSGRKHLDISGSATINGQAFSPDGRLLAVGFADGQIGLWDTEQGEKLFEIQSGCKHLSLLQFTSNGNSLAFADDKSPEIQILDLMKLLGQLAEIGLEW